VSIKSFEPFDVDPESACRGRMQSLWFSKVCPNIFIYIWLGLLFAARKATIRQSNGYRQPKHFLYIWLGLLFAARKATIRQSNGYRQPKHFFIYLAGGTVRGPRGKVMVTGNPSFFIYLAGGVVRGP
jgi:hypothetical protein